MSSKNVLYMRVITTVCAVGCCGITSLIAFFFSFGWIPYTGVESLVGITVCAGVTVPIVAAFVARLGLMIVNSYLSLFSLLISANDTDMINKLRMPIGSNSFIRFCIILSSVSAIVSRIVFSLIVQPIADPTFEVWLYFTALFPFLTAIIWYLGNCGIELITLNRNIMQI